MDKKSILELKRRMKKDGCTFTRIAGCYVDGNKDKIVTFNNTFLNLEDDEFYKYLEIAKKSLSGAIGNNMLELEFPREEEGPGGHQQFLMGLKASALKEEGILEAFYDMVIENYEYVGNYLILLFHDAYDVMVKTSDNNKLDESEEVYEYVICAICPVTLTKAGLGYRKDENRIGTLDRDWIVGLPQTAFTFPAFSDRSTDIHSVMFYTKDTKNPHEEVVNNILGCRKKRTATQKQNKFNDIIIEKIGEDRHDEIMDTVIEKLVEVKNEETVQEISGEKVAKIMMESGIGEETAEKIAASYSETFADEIPDADSLLDPKMLRARENKIARLELENEVMELKKQLDEVKNTEETDNLPALEVGGQNDVEKTADNEIVVNVKSEKKEQIRAEIIDGQKCIVIPMYGDEKLVIKEK